MSRPPVPVTILGATGTVGQRLVRMLAGHPWFEIAAVAASEQSAGRRYEDAVRWREPGPVPAVVGRLTVQSCDPRPGTPIAFSALDAGPARTIEPAWAESGALVVTNASAFRMDPQVPLLIPEVNPDHLGLLAAQRQRRGWRGGIVANPNCSTAAIVLALAPLHRAFGLERLVAATMQAVSGAGYPGVPSLDILASVIPYIAGEEDKVERETRKLLGTVAGEQVTDAPITVSAHTNRVPAVDGHLAVVSAGFARPVSPDEARETLEQFRAPRGVAELPSTPERPIEVDDRPDRPQTRLDADRGAGMTVTVGRIRRCPVLGLRLALLGHNLVRGAAGAAIQNAELLVASGEVGG